MHLLGLPCSLFIRVYCVFEIYDVVVSHFCGMLGSLLVLKDSSSLLYPVFYFYLFFIFLFFYFIFLFCVCVCFNNFLFPVQYPWKIFITISSKLFWFNFLEWVWKNHSPPNAILTVWCRLRQHGLDTSGAYQYFVLRAQKIALSHGYEIINWYESWIWFFITPCLHGLYILSMNVKNNREETFNDFGSKLSRKTVVHNWYDLIVTCIICIFHYGINFIFCHKYTLHWCGFVWISE